jgi:RNA recognition motif-containing protein
MKLFMKNLDSDINELQLESLLAKFGKVVSTKVVYDTITWESKGFAFVEMAKKEDGEKVIEALNGKELKGKELIVQEAEDRKRRF